MRLIALAAVVLFAPALASAQPYTFVSTPAGDSLTVIDLADNTVAASVPVSGLPTGCAIGGAGRRVYAALSEANALAIINIGTGAVRTVPVGAGPAGVAVARRRVYVANSGAGTVSVVDPDPGNVVATIPVGDGPFALVTGGRRLYVANRGAGTVSVVDTTTNSVGATIPVGTFPAGLALHIGTRRLYVANFLDDSVSVIDTDTLSVLRTIPVARRPRGLAVDAAGQRLFVAGFDDGRVQAIDPGTGTVTLDAPSGGLNPLDLMLGPQGTRLYVAHLQETEGVAVLDADTLAPVASVNVLAGPVAFAGLAQQRPPAQGRPRAPLTTGWQEAARAVFAQVRALAAVAPTRAADVSQSLDDDVVISDTEFPPESWAVSISSPFEFDTSQQPTGGNPGSWRRTTHYGPGTTVHRLIRPGSHYNPSNLGAIFNLDVSWDRRIFNETLVSEGFLVEQNNVVYRTVARTFFSPTWQTDSRFNLVADDFSNGSGGHPDFTETGSTLRFGYFRQTAFQQNVTQGIDNFVVTVRRSAPPANLLGFTKTVDVAEELDSPFVFVERRNGAQGAISVDVFTEKPDGGTVQETLSWPDGDDTARSLLVVLLTLPDGSGARTARLRLLNPTGGASIDPSRDQMAIVVFPEDWPDVIRVLYLRLLGLFGAFSPVWLILLAVPAAAMAARRRRQRV